MQSCWTNFRTPLSTFRLSTFRRALGSARISVHPHAVALVGRGRCLGARTNPIQPPRGQFWRDDSGTLAMATIPNPVSTLAPELFRTLSSVWPACHAGWRRRICVSARTGRGSRSRQGEWLEAPRSSRRMILIGPTSLRDYTGLEPRPGLPLRETKIAASAVCFGYTLIIRLPRFSPASNPISA
jgi:hypothetical protein